MPTLAEVFAHVPLVAIVRGVQPEEVEAMAEALIEGGVRAIEVPMNSPRPLDSIARLARFADRIAYGAGTVLTPDVVGQVAAAGGQLVVAPNTDVGVIGEAVARGLVPMPGFATASEAFTAYAAGARYLKLFPASTYGVSHVKALLDVLPRDAVVMPVGGVKPEQFADWWAVGARGFGLGGDLYRPGFTAAEVRERAAAAVAAIKDVMR